MSGCTKIRAFVYCALLFGFLFAIGLSASPELHARFHSDANSPNHECAVTLIATGKCKQAEAPSVLFVSQSALCFEKTAALSPIWVTAPFLEARIFEHAPPMRA
ncbi:MAG TPA: hypothetical protein VGI60_18330 [Chthoniobacterales bacterium]|jgi:hypothetical protein